MRATELAVAVMLTGMAGCDGEAPPQTEASQKPAPIAVVAGGSSEDLDGFVRSEIAVEVLPDPDSASAETATPNVIRPEQDQVLTREGTPLVLPSAAEQAKRARLALEVGGFDDVAQSDLRRLRLHWYARGAGIVFQNPTKHAFRLVVHFESSADPECGETVYRGVVAAKGSAAPAPARVTCSPDSAKVTLLDQQGFVVARATVTP